MHAHRAPSSARTRVLARALRVLAGAGLALCLVPLSALLVAAPASAQTSRAIVLSFEGWRADQARNAVANALGQQYELISEEQAINAAAQIAADVSTPEGMAAVVQHLGIELVVGGSVSGTGRRSSTTIFVLDRNGNEIGSGTAPGPTGRAAEGPIGAAALQACATAMMVLHPPQQPIIVPDEGGGQQQVVEEPPMRSMEEIENERPGQARGQGGGGSSYRAPDRRDEEGGGGGGERSGRWNQPLFRGLLQLDFRNRAAVVTHANPLMCNDPVGCQPGNFADFFPQLGLSLETRPMAQSDDALRGLYGRLDLWFSAGINYYAYELANVDPLPLQVFGIELGLGYAGTIAEVVELFGTIGFGYDSFALTLAAIISDRDLPSTGYPYLPITAGGRVRLLPSSMEGADLHLELAVGPRIVLGGGELAGTADTSDYFMPRSGTGCGTGNAGAVNCNGDFGVVSGAGINFQAGLGLIVDPGFSAALRFQYVNYFLSFADGQGTRAASSGVDESLHIQILAGWAIR